MKNQLVLLFLLFLISSCNLGSKFDREFETHTQGSVVVSDNDILHPCKVFLKNNRPIGFEFIGNPEFGQYSKKTFVDTDGEIEKIIIRKDYWRNLEGDEPFDSIYVMEPKLKKTTVYSRKNRKGTEVNRTTMILDQLFDVNEKFNEILQSNLMKNK